MPKNNTKKGHALRGRTLDNKATTTQKTQVKQEIEAMCHRFKALAEILHQSNPTMIPMAVYNPEAWDIKRRHILQCTLERKASKSQSSLHSSDSANRSGSNLSNNNPSNLPNFLRAKQSNKPMSVLQLDLNLAPTTTSEESSPIATVDKHLSAIIGEYDKRNDDLLLPDFGSIGNDLSSSFEQPPKGLPVLKPISTNGEGWPEGISPCPSPKPPVEEAKSDDSKPSLFNRSITSLFRAFNPIRRKLIKSRFPAKELPFRRGRALKRLVVWAEGQ